ncbi:TPA: hypothetical protein ACIKR3_001572 [Streptococcus agalactiae]|uniref:Uncharacterized protein n=1 Tax=Streptococcus agalactiae TaxID=1311 RepID=A0A0H1UIZ3_STRAG|nr:hypothetical protein [Streptococcus agalactiae]EPX17137.1 hypothetical protein SAG0169_10440 [Streptococcus agalactiae LDS 610]CCW41839.1 FIG01115667: hypothetical protein [Streptococcus agalactiae ILRI112]AKI57102.1 Hypothetical Protein GBS85147_0673 [Streptococcus agalactiae]ASI65723.1 hypothetical protein GT95_03670 [Streptococcus agalactiae]EGS28239.1 hypothetical protein FSLSAGS3026_03653 [Streptococcus agalactiae FSL S3-026]
MSEFLSAKPIGHNDSSNTILRIIENTKYIHHYDGKVVVEIPPQKEPIKVFFMDSHLHYLEFSDICRYVTVVLKNSTVDNITNLGLDNHIVYDNGDDMVDPLPSIQHGLFLNDD